MQTMDLDTDLRQKAVVQLTKWHEEEPSIEVSDHNILLWCTASTMTKRVGKRQFENLSSIEKSHVAKRVMSATVDDRQLIAKVLSTGKKHFKHIGTPFWMALMSDDAPPSDATLLQQDDRKDDAPPSAATLLQQDERKDNAPDALSSQSDQIVLTETQRLCMEANRQKALLRKAQRENSHQHGDDAATDAKTSVEATQVAAAADPPLAIGYMANGGSNDYFTISDHPNFPDMKCRVVPRWTKPALMGTTEKSKTIVCAHYEESKEVPGPRRICMIVLRSQMLWRFQRHDFHLQSSARQAWLTREMANLRRDVAGGTGCARADANIRQWTPGCI